MAFDQTAEVTLHDADGPNCGLELQIVADATIGYAAIQNNVPVIRVITLTNTTAAALEHVEVVVQCSPAFALAERWRFEHLAAGEIRRLAPVDLRPDHSYLSKLDEAERAIISVKATSNGLLVGEAVHAIDVLAYDQWAGTRSLPELLAAFCMPNSRVLDHLIASASALLRQSAAPGAMNGYQSKNRESVWKQVSAIYSTVAAENLHYASPPASFGTDGQKIRTPERIIDSKVATCLDLAVLFASCLEQAGLHPVVLLKQGHAWVGVWLVESSFPTALVDDVQAIRKRVKSGEFMVFETTGVAAGQKPTLRSACATGEEHLSDESLFAYAIDIRRAREVQIRPLPSRSAPVEPIPVAVSAMAAATIEDMPALPPLDPAALAPRELSGEPTPEGRLAKWKSKLLDLTLRNRLLNFKPAKTNLRVICPDPAALEDKLSEGREFRIRPMPAVMAGPDTRDAAVFNARNARSPVDALASDALGRHEIMVELDENSLDARLLEIFRTAGTGLEEGGANTLFLAFGLLEWKEEKDAEASHLAPILLIPVTLSRQSVRSGFRLTRHDDDAIVNPTLLQKLAQDFELKLPSFDVLPSDEHGIDVSRILQTFRLHVGELKGWEVKEQVHLGIFSFTKYLMWKDLQDRHKQLQENAVVAHLINNPGKVLTSSAIGFAPETLDETYRPQDLFAPLLSDSSQLRAICVASSGKNLVIEGPPGTGKSQTITNLISHLLATGKTVLFVSEKMAALEVVHRRLSSLGLGAFCLELHSSKARKADVLKQLGTALDAAGSRTSSEWEREAERLASLRLDLNGLAKALHRVHPNDLTIYDAIGTCIESAGMRPAPIHFADWATHTRAELDSLRETCRRMAALGAQLTGLATHPLAQISHSAWTPSWQQQLVDAAAMLEEATAQMQGAAAIPLGFFGLTHDELSLAELAALDRLADSLLASRAVPLGMAQAGHDETARAKLAVLRQHGCARNEAWNSLAGQYRDDVSSLDAGELTRKWAAATGSWWPKGWFLTRRFMNHLRRYRTDNTRPDQAGLPQMLSALARINSEDRAIESLSADASTLLQGVFAGARTDWDSVQSAERWAIEFSEAVLQLAGGDPEVTRWLRAKSRELLAENRSMLQPDASLGAGILAYRNAYRVFRDRLDIVTELAGCPGLLESEPAAAAAIPRLLGVLQEWRLGARQLQPWCLWQKARAEAIGAGLQGVVRSLEAGDIPLASLPAFFEYSYQNWWVREAIGAEPILCSFSSANHERKIAEFKQADERFQKLTQEFVAAKLSGQIPLSTGLTAGADSELGRLRRELQKQRKHMPVRQLLQSLPTLMPKLKPCLLMSPLSVSQYLDAAHAQFDVVIFDEASQIPVWDAVGAIARGRQLVCVGDPKQLPPTSFFGRADASEGGDDLELQDLESILDECRSIGMPELGLNWHYRSRHESLITFSNITYYDNRLVTFPSPVTEDCGVRFERVAGVYDRGGSRTNRAEADAIVKAIENHYLDPVRRRQTLGVVTFNQAQQSLIERLLDERRRASAALDQALAQPMQEPLFIKNLENVQGDERDIIYFSITYGPDITGKLSLNFGPLNLEGGHRRLNVAVSRARQGVVVFSTLLPEQIDLARVRARGVRDLKNYLEFAIRGPHALADQVTPTGREPGSPFERQVMTVLREHGWTVHPQVGVSGYRIDLGVVDPRAPGRYLLGVECDGRTYHSGATARDRDRLRQHVLEGLGWQLFRIWSTDWWINPEEPMRKLLARLEQLVMAEPTVPDQPAGSDTGAEIAALPDAAQEHASAEGVPARPALPAAAGPGLLHYEPVMLRKGEVDRFYLQESAATVKAQLFESIHSEGPIAQGLLFRKISRAWGLARLGRRIEEYLSTLLPKRVGRSVTDPDFYWPEGVDPATWEGFRVPGADMESRRAIEEICLEELGNAALYVLSQQGSTTVQGLARAVCRLFGISRTTAEAEARIVRALSSGRMAGLIKIDGGVVFN